MKKSINGHVLPDALVSAVALGKWNPPSDHQISVAFGERPAQPSFYSLEDIAFENQAWLVETNPVYLGTANDELPPGDIDPRRSVLIGDLGHDRPFALDYRDSSEQPSVVLLASTQKAGWLRIADSTEELLAKLGLTRQPVE